MPLPRPLIDRFVRHLAEVRVELSGLEAGIAAAGEGREPLRALAHKLAGTAEAYGFPAVGESARHVEEAILAVAPWEPVLAARVGELREALAGAAQEPPP